MSHPLEVIAMTRLARDDSLGFEAWWQEYLRQLARLGGWPWNVSLAG